MLHYRAAHRKIAATDKGKAIDGQPVSKVREELVGAQDRRNDHLIGNS